MSRLPLAGASSGEDAAFMSHSLAVAKFVFPFKLSLCRVLDWESEGVVISLSGIKRSLGRSSDLPLPTSLLEATQQSTTLLFIAQLHVAD